MKKDKIKVLVLQLILLVFLFFVLFAPNIIKRQILSIIIFIYMLIVYNLLKRRETKSIYKKQVIVIMLLFALMYLGVFYLLGLHFGFVKAKITLSLWSMFRFIIPLTIIIISAEIIRNVFLAQGIKLNIRSKKINISIILTYITMVLMDLIIYTDEYNLTNLDDFLIAIGFVLFASFSSNLLFNYIASRYGSKGNIIFRLITVLYIYIIPITPDVYIFLNSFLRMVCPYLIYLILEKLYSTNDFATAYSDRKKEVVGTTLLLVVITSLIMLISCQFRYGILVVGSRSMTGTLNKGDAVIFESYKEQEISKGQIIIFDYNGIQTIHRVIEIKEVNGEYQYYTKGDYNKEKDEGYITNNNINGLVRLKVKYIGYPTIWIRNLFS